MARAAVVRTESDASASDQMAALLKGTIEGLGTLDAERLERLAEEAEALSRRCTQLVERPLELRALRQTLSDVLRTTEGNLRILRGLRGLPMVGLGGDEGLRWER